MDQNTLSFPRKLWLLFFTFAKISALVVGGGLAMLPVIEDVFVNKYKIIDKDELLDMIQLTQTIPGIIAATSSVFIGMRVAGFAGACCALLGAIFPSFLIIVIIAAFFPYLNPQNPYLLGAFSGVRACIAGLIMATALKMLKKTIHNTWEALLTVIALILLLGPVHSVYLILAAIPLGILYIFWVDKKRNVANKVQKEEVKS